MRSESASGNGASARGPHIGVALSGGGHRAALFGLGALLYLVDAGKNREVASIASVSGGSLTNGFVAQAVDFAAATPAVLDQAVRPLARAVARRGLVWPPPPRLVLGALALAALLAVAVTVWFWPAVEITVVVGRVPPLRAAWDWARAHGWPLRLLASLLCLVLAGLLLQARGRLFSGILARRLFSPSGRPTRLRDAHTGVDHVICATDLHAGENVYFSPRFVCAYRFGLGEPGELPLHVAVQASAAYPGGFPPRRLSVAPLRFQNGLPEARGVRALVLADGGVYDNMADQWVKGQQRRRLELANHKTPPAGEAPAALDSPWNPDDPGKWETRQDVETWEMVADLSYAARLDQAAVRKNGVKRDNSHPPEDDSPWRPADELVVVNASPGLGFRPVRGLRLPLVAEAAALLRDVGVLFDNGTSLRRQWLVESFQAAQRTGRGLRGALVHIPQPAYHVARKYARDASDPARTARARAVRTALGILPPAYWRDLAARCAGVSTSLSRLGTDLSADLLYHGYILAMCNLHVLLGYPLLPVPGRTRFEALCR